MSLTDLSIKNRTTVFFAMVAVTLAGIYAYRTLPREAFPDVQIPLVIVYTLYPGAAPADVENQITDEVERELQGIDDLKTITSTSQESASVVTVEFVAGTDIDDALAKVRERVDRAKVEFPTDAEEPLLQEVNFSDIPVLQINLSGDLGLVALKNLAEDLKDELEAQPGVLRVDVLGGLEREVKVDVDPERLRLYGLGLQDVIDTVRDENVAIPGGDLDLGDRSFAVRVPGEVTDPSAVGEFVIATKNGSPIFVRDVARVSYGFEDRASYARIDGRDSVALAIQKRQGANIVEVADLSRETALELAADWPDGVEINFLGDLSKEVRQIVHDLENNILSGLVLVVVVLMFVLGFRNALFVGIAIPFSMLLTFFVISLADISLNNVVLFSLVLAVGMLVDNAVVVIENIYRHRQLGMPLAEAASFGTREVAAAIFVSTLTTVAAFSPLLFWPGIVGDFMFFLPLTVCIVLAASLLVALTVNPVLCATFMKVPPSQRLGPDGEPLETVEKPGLRGRFERALERMGAVISRTYQRTLEWSLGHRALVVGGTLASFVVVVVLYGMFQNGIEFFPETEPSQIVVDVEMPSGARLERTDEVVRQFEERLMETPDLEFIAAATGAGSQADFGVSGGGGDATKGRLTLDLYDRVDREENSFETMDWVRERTAGLPGVVVEVDRPAEGPPVGDPLSIEIAGDDFAALGAIAERVQETIRDIPGLVSLSSDFDSARPELIIDVDRTQAARLGLTTAKIASTIRTAVNGTEASTFRQAEEDDQVDITVRLSPESRQSMEDLAQLTVQTEAGAQIPIASIATLRQGSALTSIQHKDRDRVVTVSGDVTSPDLAEPVRQEAERRLAEVENLLPAGYTLTFAGQSQDEEEAKAFLTEAFLFAILLVMALMVSKFNSVAIPFIIITSVLMSMVGVLLGLLVTGLPFGIIMTGIGVISLAGIVVNNAIVLLDYGEQLWATGMSRRETVIETGLRRMRPVLLTAVTTILGLIPLSTGVEFDFTSFQFAAGGESSQWWKGMGVAVIFGLAFATFLTLVLVPVLYDVVLQWRERKAEKEAERGERAELEEGELDDGGLVPAE